MDRAHCSWNFKRTVSAENFDHSQRQDLHQNAVPENQTPSGEWDWTILPEWFTSPNSGRILPEKVRFPLPAGTPKVLAKWRKYISERRIRTGYVQILEEQMADALHILHSAFQTCGEEGLLAVLELGIQGGKDGKNWLRLEYPELKKSVQDDVSVNRAVWRKLGYFGNLWDTNEPGLPVYYEYDFWDGFLTGEDPYGRYLAALNGAGKPIDAELFPVPKEKNATRAEMLKVLLEVFESMGKNSHPTAVSARKELQELLGPAPAPAHETACEEPETACETLETVCEEPETACETLETVCETLETVCETLETACEEPETVCEEPETVCEEPETVYAESEEFISESTENTQKCAENEVFQRGVRKKTRKTQRNAGISETPFPCASQWRTVRFFCGRNRGSPSPGLAARDAPLPGSCAQLEENFTRGSCRRTYRRRGSSE